MMNAIKYKLSLPLLLTVSILLFSKFSQSQTWTYNFGNSTGVYTTTSGVNTTLLPQPATGGGNEQLSIGTVALGSGFYLDNPGLPGLGNGSELRSTASTGTAVNKFSVYGYNPSKVFYTRFNVLFGNLLGLAGPKAGNWYFYQGTGPLYSNTANASTTTGQSFISLRFSFANGGIVNMAYHNGTTWINLVPILGFSLSQETIYSMEIYGNNGPTADSYISGSSYTIASDKWDLWINGVRVVAGLSSGSLANNVNIDSWLFAGEQSTTNYATIFLDDIIYSNALPGSTLPINLISFKGTSTKEGVELNLQTASETGNDYFTIETSKDASDFSELMQVPGAGNSNTLLSYQVLDTRNLQGTVYYRLKQTDYDGAFAYSEVISVDPASGTAQLSLSNIIAGQEEISFQLNGGAGIYQATVYSIDGRQVSSAQVEITDASQTNSLAVAIPAAGIYLLRLSSDQGVVSEKFYGH
jgi:hypothetical protein